MFVELKVPISNRFLRKLARSTSTREGENRRWITIFPAQTKGVAETLIKIRVMVFNLAISPELPVHTATIPFPNYDAEIDDKHNNNERGANRYSSSVC